MLGNGFDGVQHNFSYSEKRKKIALEYIPFQDGLAYKRNVDFLEEIIQ